MDTKAGNYNQNTLSAIEQVGWTRADYELLKLWWTYDETVYNYQKMKDFSRYNNPEAIPLISMISPIRGLYCLCSTFTFLFIVLLIIIPILLRPYSYQTYHNISESCCPSKMAITILWLIGLLSCGLFLIRAPERIAISLYIFFLVVVVTMRPLLTTNWMVRHPTRVFVVILLFILGLNYYNSKALAQEAKNYLNFENNTNQNIEQIMR